MRLKELVDGNTFREHPVPEMVASHVVYVLVHHVETYGLGVTVTLDGPGLLLSVVALGHHGGG
jgi:hypothetical protein